VQTLERSVLRLAVPAVVSNLLFTLRSVADTMMLGRYPPASVSISAAGLGAMLYFLFFPLVMGLSTGAVAMIARRWGEGRYGDARYTFENIYVLLTLLSIPISVFGVFFGWTLPALLGADAAVIAGTQNYAMGVFAFYPLGVFITVYHSSIRAAGDTKTPMYVDLVSNVYNVAMNYALIFGNFGMPELGVFGAGLATGTSYLVGAVMYLLLQRRGRLIISPSLLSRNPVQRDVIWKMFRIGIPAGIERGMWSIAAIFYTGLILQFGSTAYSGFQVGLRAEGFAYLPGLGFSIAATTLVGQHLGAREPETARKAAVVATRQCALLMGFVGLILILFPRQIASAFTSDPEIIEQASLYLFLMGFTEPALGALFTLAGGMRGAGYTTAPMLVNAFGLLVVRLGIAYALAFPLGMGVLGIWLGMVAETFIRAFMMYLIFRRGAWMRVIV